MGLAKQIKIASSIVVGFAVLVWLGFSTWYTLDESEQSVVMTFGVPGETVTDPGLKFKLPYPMQSVEILSTETFSTTFGYKEENGEVVSESIADTKMITGDENIVLADLVVQWKITDPTKFLYNSDNPETILYNATSASLRTVIGSSKIDDALTSGKAEIDANVLESLKTRMKEYDLGVSIIAVKLQDVELPTQEVRKAFTNVTDARETMNTKINEANKYRNKAMNEAEGEKDAIISKAHGDKTARIENARGAVAVFDSIYKEYADQPGVTERRLIIEALEKVYKGKKVYVMDSGDDGVVKYLPIDNLNKKNNQ